MNVGYFDLMGEEGEVFECDGFVFVVFSDIFYYEMGWEGLVVGKIVWEIYVGCLVIWRVDNVEWVCVFFIIRNELKVSYKKVLREYYLVVVLWLYFIIFVLFVSWSIMDDGFIVFIIFYIWNIIVVFDYFFFFNIFSIVYGLYFFDFEWLWVG